MRKLLGVLCLATALCAAILASPKAAVAAGAISSYQPRKLEMGVLNQAMFQDSNAYDAFYAKYVTAHSAFNQIDRFGPVQLLYGGSYIRPYYNISMQMGGIDSEHNWVMPVMDSLRVKDDLQMLMRATIHTVMHYGPNHEETEVLAFTAIRLLQGINGEDILATRTCMDPVTAATAVGDGAWFKPRSKTIGTGTTFRLQVRTDDNWYSGDCNCGDARISNIAIAFADVVPPKLAKVTVTSDAAGLSPKAAFGQGETLYIHLHFDEYVRFSDNSALHDDVKLYLDVFDVGEQQVTGSSVIASLHSLSEKRVTFAYTVTENITVGSGSTTVPTNHYIGGVSKNQPTLISGPTKFPLVILNNNGSPVDLPASLRMYTQLTETTSLITDLAGNPVSSLNYALNQETRCKIDSVNPVVEKVDVSHDPAIPIFAGPEDQLVFSATFSEALNVDPADLAGVTGTLNLQPRTGGTQETVAAASISDDCRTLTFAPLIIETGMRPVTANINGTQVAYASLTAITFPTTTFPDGATDMCGNPYDGAVNKAPRSEFYVDTLGPTASAGLTADGSGHYEPVVSGSGFYFPFSLADSEADGESYASGLAPRGASTGPVGEFSWVNNETGGGQYSFEWVVTSSATAPDTGWAIGATGERYPFPQIEGADPQYLHVRLIDSVQYNISDSSLVFYPEDFAGNESSAEFPLNYISDEVGPAYIVTGYSTQYDSGTAEGSILAGVRIVDPSKVNPGTIRYQWVPRGETAPDSDGPGWTDYTETLGDAATSFELDIATTGLPSGTDYVYDLYVTSRDLEISKDPLGNESLSQALPFEAYFSCPAYGLDVNDAISADPALTLTPPNRHPTEGTPSTMIVMVKDPLGPSDNEYFVRTLNSEGWGATGDVLSGLIWTTDDPTSNVYWNDTAYRETLNAWRYVKLIRDGDFTLYDGMTVSNVQYGFANARGVNGLGDNLYDLYTDSADGYNSRIATAQRLMAIVDGKYYGDIEVEVVTGYGATGPAVWETVYAVGGGDVYNVNARNNGVFVNEAAYFWDNPADPNDEGYYYDADLTFEVDLACAVYPDDRPSAGYFVSYIPDGVPVVSQSWTLRAAPGSVVLVQPNETYDYAPLGFNHGFESYGQSTHDLSALHVVTVEPADPVRKAELAGAAGWSDPGDGPKYVDSIDGEEIRVTLENLIAPSWGVDDMDFAGAGTYLSLQLLTSPDAGAPVSGTEIYRTALEPRAVQTITLPNVTAYSGQYRIVVSAKAKVSGVVSTGSYDDIYVDRTGIAEFGLARVASTVTGDVLTRETEAWHGYDSVSKPGADYEYPSLRLGNAVGGHVSSLTHTLYFTSKTAGIEAGGTTYGELFIKVWNASSGLSPEDVSAGKAAANWVPLSTECAAGYEAVVVSDAASVLGNYLDGYGDPLVPLLAGQENMLYYQVASSSGKASEARALFVTVSDELAELEVDLDPSESDVILNHTMANVTKLTSHTFESLNAYYLNGTDSEPVSESKRLTRSGTHVFYATNAFGNYTFVEKEVDFVDGTAPEVADAYNMMYSDHFELKYLISDNYTPGGAIPAGFSFYLRFDPDYNERLGYGPEEFIEIELPDYTSEQLDDHIRTATQPSGAGIYEVIASRVGSDLLVALKGLFKYDPSEGAEVSHTVDVYVTDIAGNSSAFLEEDSATMDNTKPAITGMLTDRYTNEDYGWSNFIDVIAEFNVPVLLNSPAAKGDTTQFSKTKHYLSIYADVEDYKFDFTDIFGDYYSPDSAEPYHIDPVDITCLDGYSIDVTYSTTEPTNEGVRVDIRAMDPGLVFSAWQGLGDGDNQFASHTDYVYRILTENDTLYCMLQPGTPNARFVEIPVTNIFTSPPAASIKWYFSEFASNTLPAGVTETTGEVTAYLTSPLGGRPVHSINGTSESYTFTFGDMTSSAYTFEFADAAGNVGAPLTAYLPVNIVMPPAAPSDVTAPQYHLNIYARYNGVHNLMGSWSNLTGWSSAYGSFSATLDAISWTSGYLLNFDLIQDESPTRLLLLPADTDLGTANLNFETSPSEIPPEGIDGLSLSGKLVSISENASFMVAVLDKSNNVTAFSVTASLVDTEAPTITVEKVKTDFYAARLYVNVADDKDPAPVLIIPAGAPKLIDGSSTYDGWYYFDFDGNGSTQLVAEDTARNRVTATASVDDIDTSEPTSRILWWSPCDAQDPLQPPFGPLNKDVSVGLGFDRIIESITLSAIVSGLDVPDADVDGYIRVDLMGDKAVLTLLKHVDSVTVEYTGQNGKKGIRSLTWGQDYTFIIDKVPPTISVSDLSGLDVASARSVTVTFTVEDEFIVTEDGQYFDVNNTIDRTISSRGRFTYRFSDMAGNVTEKTVEVKNIDVEPPVIMVMGEDNGGAYKRGEHVFCATLSERGEITFGGVAQGVAAPRDLDGDGKLALDDLDEIASSRECDWKELRVSQNGTYQIIAEDMSGRKSSTYVTVSCLDNSPPTIVFSPPTTLSVRQGTTLVDFQTMLLQYEGVVVSDNISVPTNIQLSVDLEGWTEARLNGTGISSVNYTAVDEAGNSRTVSRNVKIYPENELIVTVNGQKTESSSTTVFIGESSFAVGIENLSGGDGEPVKIYLLAGRYTAGQMKSLSTEVGRTFTVDGKGYYTLYIVSQSRQAYLTYLYIQ